MFRVTIKEKIYPEVEQTKAENLLVQRLKMRFLIWSSGKGLLGGGHHRRPPLTVTSLPVEVQRLALLCHFLIKMLTFCWVIT